MSPPDARRGPDTGPRSDQTAAKRIDHPEDTSGVETGPGGREATHTGDQRFEWRVRYRRAGWEFAKTRIFQSERPARTLVRRLRTPSKKTQHLTEVVELAVHQRQVPVEWSMVDEIIAMPAPDEECARWWVTW